MSTKGGKIEPGKKITVRAKAKKGYKFAGWYVGKKKVSSKAKYTFKVKKKMTLKAKFKKR